ncbi:MAG: hypothetical protein ACKO37_06135 [Vampirovibrionales bacterium]
MNASFIPPTLSLSSQAPLSLFPEPQTVLWLDTPCFFPRHGVQAGVWSSQEVPAWQWQYPQEESETAGLSREGTMALLLAMHPQEASQATFPPWETLTHVLVHQGPGSFTGLRQGMLMARAIAQVYPRLHVGCVTGLQLAYVYTALQRYRVPVHHGAVRVSVALEKQGLWLSQVFQAPDALLQPISTVETLTTAQLMAQGVLEQGAEKTQTPLTQVLIGSEELLEAHPALTHLPHGQYALPWACTDTYRLVDFLLRDPLLQRVLGLTWHQGYASLMPFYAMPPSITPPRVRPKRVF